VVAGPNDTLKTAQVLPKASTSLGPKSAGPSPLRLRVGVVSHPPVDCAVLGAGSLHREIPQRAQ
jgi:hypothetical protein